MRARPSPEGRGENVNCRRKAAPLKAGQAVRPDTEIHAGGLSGKRIGVAAAGEVDASRQRAAHPPPATWLQGGCTEVRGFRRGNNANNTNMSPFYVNGNNAPSNTNSNIAFGN